MASSNVNYKQDEIPAAAPTPQSKQAKPRAPVATIFTMPKTSSEVAGWFMEAYKPKEVFLGLYHASDSARSRLEPVKSACCDWLFKEYNSREKAAAACQDKLKAELKSAADCYYELEKELSTSGTAPVKLDEDASATAAANRLFQDACFVIAVLNLHFSRSQVTGDGSSTRKGDKGSDSWARVEDLVSKSLSLEQAKSDLMKLSNQLPMRVLWTVLEHANVPPITAATWFSHWNQTQFPEYPPPTAPLTPLYPGTKHHLVHYLQSAYTTAVSAGSSPPPPPGIDRRQLPSAEVLSRAGIRFAKPTASTSLLEIQLTEGGKLNIPKINASPHWMVLLQNLVHFEQSMIEARGAAAAATVTPVFSTYVKLLAGLLRTPKDVQLLRDGVGIDHRLKSDQELVDFLRWLSSQVTTLSSTPHFNKLITDVAKHMQPKSSSSRTWITNYLPSKVGSSWIRRTWKPLAALLIVAALGTYTTTRARARNNVKKVKKPQKSKPQHINFTAT